jgi:glycosyltransferase involved in cell wall biosynthesis
MLDILYVAYNRLELTRETFTAFTRNTNWEHVRQVFVHDDGSVDGTAEWLSEACYELNLMTDKADLALFETSRLGGPVAAMNWYLDKQTDADRFAKIDNDFVVCPGWLDEMARMMTAHPELDILGLEPWNPGPPQPRNLGDGCYFGSRVITPAQHIGGKGIIRKRAFEVCRPSPNGFNGYGGFTEWQMEHKYVEKAWITPDLPCFGIDQLPFEPWVSLCQEYRSRGWQRSWPTYPSDGTMNAYWDWWEPVAA